MSIQRTCPYCGGRGYITHIEALPDCGRAWTKRCIACEGAGFILYQETNADRIRRMSDEEMAEFLILSPEMEFDVCRFCEYGNTSGDDRGICLTDDGICRAEANCAAFKKWLQQPVEENA